jgi:hypothetical protein
MVNKLAPLVVREFSWANSLHEPVFTGTQGLLCVLHRVFLLKRLVLFRAGKLPQFSAEVGREC